MKVRYGVGVALVLVVLSAGCSRQGKLDRHLERGNQHFEAGRYEAATLEYRNVLRDDPSNRTAIVRSALAHYELGRGPEAGALLQEAVELEPENVELRLKLGTLYRAAGMIPEARNQAIAILEIEPDHLGGLLLLGETSREPEEIEAAEARLAEREDRFGEDHRYYLAMAQLKLRRGEPDAAEPFLDRALALAPENVTLLGALAEYHASRGDRDRAATFARRAAEHAEAVSEARVKWAGLRYTRGERDAARQSLREMVEEDPAFLPAWAMLGDIALQEGRLDDVEEAARAMLDVDPRRADSRLLLGRLHLARGESAEAVELFEALCEEHESSGVLRRHLGLAYLEDRRLEQAKAALGEAVALDPDALLPALQLAELNLRTGDTSGAIRDLEQLIDGRDEIPEALTLLGQAYLTNREPERAIAVFRELEEMRPESYLGPLLRGEVLLREGRTREAREAFEMASARGPNAERVVARLAALDLREGKGDDAVARVEAAIVRMPDAAGLYQLLGSIHARRGQFESAENAFRSAIERDPSDPDSYLSLTRMFAQLDRVDEALAEAEEALAVGPDEVGALMLSGMLNEQTGDYDEALERYLRIIDVAPDAPMAWNNAAYLYAEVKGDLDRAFEFAKQARELAPRAAAIADTLGWIAYRRGEFAWARSLILQAAEGYPEHPEVLYHAGMAQLAMGEEDKAREALTRAVAASGGSLKNEAELGVLVNLLSVPVDRVRGEHRPLIDAVLTADPEDPAARVRRAALLAGSGDAAAWSRARTDLEAVLADYPRFLPAALELMDLYDARMQDPERTMALARRARENWPDDPEVAARAGRLALRLGDPAWAYSLLQSSVRAAPDDPTRKYDLALAAYSIGRIDEAERLAVEAGPGADAETPATRAAERLLVLIRAHAAKSPSSGAVTLARGIDAEDPLYPAAQMVVARALDRAGDEAAAAATYSRILERAPALALAAREAARLYAEALGDTAKAYPFAVRAREALPGDPVVARVLGRLVYEREEFPYAVGLLEQAVQASPEDAEILYLLGFSRLENGDVTRARNALQRAVAANPQSVHAERANEALAEAEQRSPP